MAEGVVAVGSRAAAATKAGIAVDRAGCQGRGAVPGQSRNSCWPRGSHPVLAETQRWPVLRLPGL